MMVDLARGTFTRRSKNWETRGATESRSHKLVPCNLCGFLCRRSSWVGGIFVSSFRRHHSGLVESRPVV